MKKLLLLLSFAGTMAVNAQDFWTEYSTSQPVATTTARSISFVDANNVWLSMSCGTTGCAKIRRYAKSADSGLTWTTNAINLGAQNTNLEISMIHAFSTQVAWASVFGTAGATGGVWKTIDGGATWNRQASALYNLPSSFANFVYFFNANDGVTMGDPSPAGFEVYTTSNGGTTWTAASGLPTPLGLDAVTGDYNEYGYTNGFNVVGNKIWINTAYGRLLTSSDKGITWNIYQTPVPDFGGQVNGTETADVAFKDANMGMITTSEYKCYTTTDGGITWSAPLAYTGLLRGFGISDYPGLPGAYITFGSDVINADNDNFRGSSFTIDNGLNWININGNPDVAVVRGTQAVFFNSSVGLATGFNANSTVGGIFKWNNRNLLLTTTVASLDKLFTVSPNPTSDKLSLTGANINQVQITDILGKVVMNNNYSALSNVELNIADFNAGIYMVKITNNEGQTSVVKVVKQ